MEVGDPPIFKGPETCSATRFPVSTWARCVPHELSSGQRAVTQQTQREGNTIMSDETDVAIVGAGPYGLSIAAHLRAAGVDYRHFGMPMRLWQAAMPQGMFLKSQGFASNLADPEGTHTLEAFCQATGRPYASYGRPVPLDTFVTHGQWFQSGLGLAIEEVL